MKKSSTKRGYWSEYWQGFGFEIAQPHHPVRQWIEAEAPDTRNASCFEIGCYPGKFLSVLGEKGYTLNGLDFLAPTQKALPCWLKKSGYKVGKIYCSDFWDFQTSEKFDLVCSFGFIEHFKEWNKVVQRHVSLAQKKGLIMIEVPNFDSPLYYLLYKIFEPEIFKDHELSAVKLENISRALVESGCRVLKVSHVGYFYFRFLTRRGKLPEAITSIINFFRPLFELFPPTVYRRYKAVSAIKLG